MIDKNTPVWQLTVGELISIIDKKTDNEASQEKKIVAEEIERYAHGLRGLAELIGCSKNHAAKLKSEGVFDGAIIQRGRKIIIDKQKALELFNKQ